MKALVGLLVVLSVATSPAAAEAQADAVRHAQALQRYRAGQELLRAEHFEKAVTEFRAAIELDSLLALAHYGLGQSYVALRRYASAIQAFTECRETYKRIIALRDEHRADMENRIDDEIRELQSVIVRIRGGNLKGYTESKITELEARVDDLRRMRHEPVTKFRPPAEVSLALGSAYFRNGDRDRAEEEWEAAVEVNPRLGEAHNNLAVVYMTSDRLDLAEAAIKAAEKTGYRVNPQLKQDVKNRRSGQ